ncbi:MAG: hypothetical protein Q9181_002034 [Wetmoreana brouardii]
MCCSSDILLALLALIFPPIAVWIKSGICTLDSLLNILLTTIGFFPGLLHAWYIIAKYPSEDDTYQDLENQHVTYYYVTDSRNDSVAGRGAGAGGVPQHQGYPYGSQRGYGTVGGMRVEGEGQGKPSGQQQQQQGQVQSQAAGEGPSQQGQGVPPSYEQAIAGDNKVQT